MPESSRYRVLHSLGKGGMGEVFLADDTQLGRKVAIKFLADRATNDSKALERLHREARSAAALDHPFICKIHEITEVDGRTGIVMEHVSGETLQTELSRTPMSPKRISRTLKFTMFRSRRPARQPIHGTSKVRRRLWYEPKTRRFAQGRACSMPKHRMISWSWRSCFRLR